jgi:UDP-N-acetylglucosamine acyltransferase
VGPFAIIEADVEIGQGTSIGPYTIVRSGTRIGRDNKVYQYASIGEDPQDKKYAGENTLLEIGDRNVIREYCTLNRGTAQDRGVTSIGNDNWIMAYVHIAHDCIVGNNTIFANAASLAGHVSIGDYVILGGFTNVHQFCILGAHAFTGLGSIIAKDVPPYVMVSGSPVKPHGLNTEGLKRRGFSADAIQKIRKAYKLLYRSNMLLEDAQGEIARMVEGCPELEIMRDFLSASERGILR